MQKMVKVYKGNHRPKLSTEFYIRRVTPDDPPETVETVDDPVSAGYMLSELKRSEPESLFIVSTGELPSYEEGSIITGTLRPQDLVPAFLEVMSMHHPWAYYQFLKECSELGQDPEIFEDENNPFWLKEDAQDLTNELIDVINSAPGMPDGMYFGAHDGDGADFGFWSESLPVC